MQQQFKILNKIRVFLFFIIMLFANSVYALECRTMETFVEDFKNDVYANLEFSQSKENEATIAFKLSPEGKISGFKILSSGGSNFDKALLKAFIAVNNNKRMDGYYINKDIYFIGKFNANKNYKETNPNAQRVYSYSNTIAKDINKINSTLTKWRSFEIKPVLVWMELNKDGSVFNTKLIQSSGIEKIDKEFIQKISSHHFNTPPKDFKNSDLRFVVSAYPLDDELKEVYRNYLRQIGDSLFKHSPYAKNRTVLLKMEIERNGHLKHPELMTEIDSAVYKAILASRYGQITLPAFPMKLELDSITFTYEFSKSPNRLQTGSRYYKVRTLPNYVAF